MCIKSVLCVRSTSETGVSWWLTEGGHLQNRDSCSPADQCFENRKQVYIAYFQW